MSVRSIVVALAACATAVALVAGTSSGGASAAGQLRTPALPMVTPYPTGPVPVGPGELQRHLKYTCSANFAGLNLGTHGYTVEVTTEYPEVARPGDVLPARQARMGFYPDSPYSSLHQAVRDLLKGRSFEARADEDWGVTTAGRTTSLDTGLVVPRAPIPEYVPEGGPTFGSPWYLLGTTTLPAITVPSGAEGALWLSAPRRVALKGVLELEGGHTEVAVLECVAPADHFVGGIALEGSTDPTAPTEVPPDPSTPTSGPTSEPPTDPTGPTSGPTTGTPPTDPQGVPVGPGELSRFVVYSCRVEAAGLDLGTYDFLVAPVADFPETAAPGDVLPARDVRFLFNLPELLRQSTSLLLGAKEFEGRTTDTTWSLTTAGRSDTFAAGGLVLPRSPVPETPPGVQWTPGGSVRLPAVTVPQDAARGLWLGLPERLSVAGDLVKADGSTDPMSWDCTAPADRILGGIALEGWTYPGTTPPTTSPTTPTPSAEPTTLDTAPPTTRPTTSHTPTAEPTTAPTTPPVLLQPTVKAGALGLWRSAVFTVGVQAKGVTPTGSVVVRSGGTTVAKGRLVLGIAVLTAGNLPRGEQTFTITYEGDRRVAAGTVTKKVRIR